MRRIYHLILLLGILIITGCGEEKQPFFGPTQVDFCEKNDTIITASAHDFTISMVRPCGNISPAHWKFSTLQIWDNSKPDSLWQDNSEWDYYSDLDLEKTSTSISYDWIRFEKVNDAESLKFRVIVQENTSNEPRTIRVMFSNNDKNTTSFIGYFIVSQKARPDMEVKLPISSVIE